MGLGLNETAPIAEDSTRTRRRSSKWTTDQNLVGGNTGSQSSGSKRANPSDASDSNSIGSTVRPMGRDAAKKKAKKKGKSASLEVSNEHWNEFKQLKEQELEQLDKIVMRQEEAN
ncbi:unnamed protein product [Microthlaspi erraticum]|uniref:No apical meristem-associated C-terminal domain-containing protein n=1 Tax=Microthlaspi erraticum TaxID=1685480 RepID=A0A6D2IFD6_9BRAS|nr:unnamed protein product [Microthlaspi erraticum]